MAQHPSRPASGRSASDWLTTLPTVALLVLILVISTGELIHGQFLKFGEVIFSDATHHVQYAFLRADPVPPTCDRHLDIDAAVARQQAVARVPATQGSIDDLFTDEPVNPEALRESMKATLRDCVAHHTLYEQLRQHITPTLRFYRALEGSFFVLFQFGAEHRAVILLLLLSITAVHTTLGFHHICLRPPRHGRDYQAQSLGMLLANGALLFSVVRYFQISSNSGIAIEEPAIFYLWMVLFGALALSGLYRLVRPPVPASGELGRWKDALECVPLIATLGIATSVYFFAVGHPSGPAIYANKILDFISLPLALALHIWAGMLFKQSRLVDLFMNILRPWKLSPEALTYLILLAAGLPTAYAGVSSVFVIAAGAIVYHEVRAVGGTSQYALAATAMSGSLGVVLRPSLLVVGIAALNRQVTTNQLFYWGGFVFALTSTLFFLASQLHRHNRHQAAQVASPRVAIPAMLREVKVVLPYVAVIALITLFYSEVLDTPFNEISAPGILPIMMLLVLVFDKKFEARDEARAASRAMPFSGDELRSLGAAAVVPSTTSPVAATLAKADAAPAYAASRQRTAGAAIHAASAETVEHVGAYISLMLFTQLVSGMVERSEIMQMAPQHFPNVWLAMAFLVVAKVVLGMVMEPLGAVMLVSATLAPMAYNNGIEPVHFWMMVLVAFELGYLLPPVALNQLLTRQVVGEAEIDRADAEVRGLSFYRRYERWILPCAVMSLSLAIVAFGPLLVQHVDALKPVLGWFHGPL